MSLIPGNQPSDSNTLNKASSVYEHTTRKYLERIEIVDDEWCGFHSLAYIIYKNQEKYFEVKEKIYKYVLQNADLCCTYICPGYDTIYNDLLKRMAYGVEPKLPQGTSCRRQYWLDAAQDLQVAANTFLKPIASYSSSGHSSQLYLPFDLPQGQSLPEVIHFVNGNHFETIKTKRVLKMEWPPVCPSSMVTWQALGRNIDAYKAGWKYIHRKQWQENDRSNATKEKAIALDGDETRTIDELIEVFDQLVKEEEEIKKNNEGVVKCPFCLGPLSTPLVPMTQAVKKEYEEYLGRNEAFKKKWRKKMENVSVRHRRRTPEGGIGLKEKLHFCRVHHVETVHKKEANKAGYPMEIDFKALPEKVLSFKNSLLMIAKGTLDSSFLKVEIEFIKENSVIKSRSTSGQFSHFDKASAGYYGNRGVIEILFKSQSLNPITHYEPQNMKNYEY